MVNTTDSVYGLSTKGEKYSHNKCVLEWYKNFQSFNKIHFDQNKIER
jgi:hypothetical protein